jgi:hypothetical protein
MDPVGSTPPFKLSSASQNFRRGSRMARKIPRTPSRCVFQRFGEVVEMRDFVTFMNVYGPPICLPEKALEIRMS